MDCNCVSGWGSFLLSRCLSSLSLYLKYASEGAEVVRGVSVCEVWGQSLRLHRIDNPCLLHLKLTDGHT